MKLPRNPLRIGLLVNGPEIQGELVQALRRAAEDGVGDVVAVIERIAPSTGKRPGRLRRHWVHRSTLAFRILARLDSRRRGLPQPPLPVPVAELAPAAVRIPVTPIEGKFTDAIAAADLELIKAANLDVLIRGGFRILTGGILTSARHGVLSFHHGDNRTNRGGPAGVWEVLDDLPTTGVVLQQLSEELDGGRVVARSIGATQRFSFHRNRVHALRRSSAMLYRSLQRLWEGKPATQDAVREDPSWSGYCHPLRRTPTNRELLGRLPRLGARYLLQRVKSWRYHNQWQVAWSWRDAADGGVPASVLRRYRPWRPPADRFWADPFPVTAEGRYWLLMEEYRYAQGKGTIAAVEMNARGPIGDPAVVLEEPWHLSYPFILQHAGEWFMLPEASASGKAQLYRAAAFPQRWEPYRTLLDGMRVYDATLHHEDGTWYLFCTVAQDGIASDEELHLYWAETLEGPYHPHPANPLVTDVTCARMAGRLFRVDGQLYRPAQNCAPHYGAGISLQVVSRLTRSEYQESTAQTLMPFWDDESVGLHTINAAGALSTIDLLRRVRR